MIEVDGLRKLYDRYLAVDCISFTLGKGQICGLIGPNGAGKTTTMRCISGLIPATAGSLTVADCCVQSDLNRLKSKLAYVPDDPPLFDDLSVGDHMEFIGRLYRVPDHHENPSTCSDNSSCSTNTKQVRRPFHVACVKNLRSAVPTSTRLR